MNYLDIAYNMGKEAAVSDVAKRGLEGAKELAHGVGSKVRNAFAGAPGAFKGTAEEAMRTAPNFEHVQRLEPALAEHLIDVANGAGNLDRVNSAANVLRNRTIAGGVGGAALGGAGGYAADDGSFGGTLGGALAGGTLGALGGRVLGARGDMARYLPGAKEALPEGYNVSALVRQ